jgi:hypothetical protein
MERRFEERRPCNLDARLTGLKNGDTGSGRITDISQSGICIVSPLQFERGDIVQLDLADSRVFGHTAYCQAEASLFRTGIEVVQVLVGGTQLTRLLGTILVDAAPAVPEPTEIRLG